MEWPLNSSWIMNGVQRFLRSGMPDFFALLKIPFNALWPNMPWQGAYLECTVHSKGLGVVQVLGQQRIALPSSVLASSDLPLHLILPSHCVLHSRLSLPNITKAKLASLLTHEVSRHTPFSAEQVTYTWKALDADSSAEQLLLDFWVLSTQELARNCQMHGIALKRCHRVDVINADGIHSGINLLPISQQASNLAPTLFAYLAAGGLCLLLLLSGLYVVLHNRANDVENWQKKVAALELESKPIQRMKNAVHQQQQTQKLLAQIHRANPKRLAILDELTRCLPVDAVLDRFSISGKQVLIDGEAHSPEALISDLQCSKLLVSPSLVGTLQANVQTGKQRFSLRAELARDNQHAP